MTANYNRFAIHSEKVTDLLKLKVKFISQIDSPHFDISTLPILFS